MDTAALSAKLVELAALLAERDAKVAQLNDFVKNRSGCSLLSLSFAIAAAVATAAAAVPAAPLLPTYVDMKNRSITIDQKR